MSEGKSGSELARKVFGRLAEDGVECVILHHFDFEEGGDIDFCAPVTDLDSFLGHLRRAVELEGGELVQVFVHEQSGAYIVCRDSRRPGHFLLFDYCHDYRIRGHLVLERSELLESAHALSWGGKGSHGFIELAYRFTKAAAKKKTPREVTRDLQSLYEGHAGQFEAWLQKRWDLGLQEWDEACVTLVLGQLGQRLAKQNWSVAEMTLKIRRVMKPRGLWLECPDELAPGIGSEVAPCFRKVKKGGQSLKAVLGSTLVIETKGETPAWKRRILKWMNCWVEATSSEELVQFLVERNARYQNWE